MLSQLQAECDSDLAINSKTCQCIQYRSRMADDVRSVPCSNEPELWSPLLVVQRAAADRRRFGSMASRDLASGETGRSFDTSIKTECRLEVLHGVRVSQASLDRCLIAQRLQDRLQSLQQLQ